MKTQYLTVQIVLELISLIHSFSIFLMNEIKSLFFYILSSKAKPEPPPWDNLPVLYIHGERLLERQ